MDTVVSNSALLSMPPQLLRHVPRTVTSSTSYSFHHTCRLTLSSSKKLFFSGHNKRVGRRRSSSSCSKFSVVTSSAAIQEINQTQFRDSVLNSDRPVLVEFVASWCGPCRLISPAMEWIAQEYKDRLTVVKIDHDANPQLIEEYKVYGLPALILFNNGKEVPESRREGAITKVKLKEYVDAFLESNSLA